MLPVRTDKPISKTRIMEAMEVVKKIRIKRAMKAGEIVAADLCGANLVATRDTDALAINMRHKGL
jgi:CxxC motif-containing protein